MLGTYTLSPGPGDTTKVEYTFETLPALLSDRLMEVLGGRRWTRRQATRALRRLRTILEENRGRGRGPPLPRVELDSRPPMTRPRTARRVTLLVASALAATALAACGHKQANPTTADTEGSYVRAGDVTYQVQLSRQLNPYATEDHSYFAGDLGHRGATRPAVVRDLPVGQERDQARPHHERLDRHRRYPGQQVLPGAAQLVDQPVRVDRADAAPARYRAGARQHRDRSGPPRAASCCSSSTTRSTQTGR